jgi:hypothetical protein
MATFWSIAIVSAGIITPNIQYVGNFQNETLCQKAVEVLKVQQFPQQLKTICVEYPVPPELPPSAPPKPPSQSLSSKDAKK